MYCPFKRGTCVERCMMWNVASNLCNVKSGLDFFLSISDTIMNSNGIQSIDNRTAPDAICPFVTTEKCLVSGCMFWDDYINQCSLLSALLNYESQALWVISQSPSTEIPPEPPPVEKPVIPESKPQVYESPTIPEQKTLSPNPEEKEDSKKGENNEKGEIDEKDTEDNKPDK